jgi:hypothetical protein
MAEVLRLVPDRVAWRAVEGEVVALDLNTSTYLAVNRTGSAVWPALERGATRDELVELITARFDVTPSDARTDLDAFLSDLRSRGVVAEG